MDAPHSSDLAAIADGAIPDDIILRLNRFAEANAGRHGQTEGLAGVVDHAPSERRSELVWLEHSPEHQDIYQLLADFVREVNEQMFRLELVGFSEMLQVATYRSEDRGFYDWHLDIGSHERANRKLSLIAPLTSPADYAGGELQLMLGPQPTLIDMPLGRIVAFPSYVLHRVTPVTRGVRRSLVAWISGPKFR